MGSHSPKRRILSSPKHAQHPPTWDVMGYWHTAEGYLWRAGQPFQSRSWPIKSAEKGRNVDVMVVRHPPGARTRWPTSRGWRWRQCANMSTWCYGECFSALSEKISGVRISWPLSYRTLKFVQYLGDGCYIILTLLRSRKYEVWKFIFIVPGKDCKSGLDCKIGSKM